MVMAVLLHSASPMILFAENVPSLPETGALISLDGAVGRALKSQAEIKRAVARLHKEEAHYRSSVAEFLPKLSADIFQAVSTGEQTSVTYLNAGVEQPIFAGGKILAGKRKHNARVETEKLKLEEVRLDVELAVRVLYAEVLKERELTRITQGEVKELIAAHGRIKNLTEKEILPRAELFRIETILQNAKYALVSHKETYDYLFTVLSETIGIGDGESLDMEPFFDVPELAEDLGGYFQTARERDPVYKIGEFRMKEKKFEKRELQADRFPHLSLAAKWNRVRDDYADTNRAMVGIQGTWNIWDFGRLGNEIDAKTSEIEETKWENEIEVREHEKELRKLFHEARAAREKIRLMETVVCERQEIQKNEKARLIAGKKGAGELVDSFMALEDAKIRRLEAITEYRILLARLGRKIAFDHGVPSTKPEAASSETREGDPE